MDTDIDYCFGLSFGFYDEDKRKAYMVPKNNIAPEDELDREEKKRLVDEFIKKAIKVLDSLKKEEMTDELNHVKTKLSEAEMWLENNHWKEFKGVKT